MAPESKPSRAVSKCSLAAGGAQVGHHNARPLKRSPAAATTDAGGPRAARDHHRTTLDTPDEFYRLRPPPTGLRRLRKCSAHAQDIRAEDTPEKRPKPISLNFHSMTIGPKCVLSQPLPNSCYAQWKLDNQINKICFEPTYVQFRAKHPGNEPELFRRCARRLQECCAHAPGIRRGSAGEAAEANFAQFPISV